MNESSETPREPPRAEAVAGEFVTENFGYDGGRQVTVYLPPDPPEAIVFAGDGQMVAHWGGLLETTNVPSTMVVGVHRAADEMRRKRCRTRAALVSPAGNGRSSHQDSCEGSPGDTPRHCTTPTPAQWTS